MTMPLSRPIQAAIPVDSGAKENDMTYSQAQINRLAKVMEDYVFAVQGERYGQRQAAEAQARQIPRMTAKTTGNLVLDWATVTWEFVRGNRSQIGADFCMNLMLTEKAVTA